MKKRARESNRAVGVAELKAHLSEHLERVRKGHEVVITAHGHPVAKLVPLPPHDNWSAREERLIREGILIPPSKPLDPKFWAKPSPIKDPGGHVLKALLEERNEGR